MYTITQAVQDIKPRLFWLKQTHILQPLLGPIDGTNRVFTVQFPPVEEGTVKVYDENGDELTTGWTLAFAETGTILFDFPPTQPRYASYTHVAITDEELRNLAQDAILEMESRYPRGITVFQDEYISSSQDQAVDPTVEPGVTFSQSKANIAFYLLCFEYVIYRAQEREAVLNAAVIREDRLSGSGIDTSRTPQAHQESLAMLDQQIEKAMRAIHTGPYGDFVPGAESDEYRSMFEWWSSSQQARGL